MVSPPLWPLFCARLLTPHRRGKSLLGIGVCTSVKDHSPCLGLLKDESVFKDDVVNSFTDGVFTSLPGTVLKFVYVFIYFSQNPMGR